MKAKCSKEKSVVEIPASRDGKINIFITHLFPCSYLIQFSNFEDEEYM